MVWCGGRKFCRSLFGVQCHFITTKLDNWRIGFSQERDAKYCGSTTKANDDIKIILYSDGLCDETSHNGPKTGTLAVPELEESNLHIVKRT